MNSFRAFIVLLLFATAVIATPPAFAKDTRSADQTELGARMEKLNASWRKLRRQVADSTQNAASLGLIVKIREAARGTESMTPAKSSDLPEAKRAQFQADYAEAMKKFCGQIDALEAALKAGDNATAGKLVAEISDSQKEAHKEFRRETDKK